MKIEPKLQEVLSAHLGYKDHVFVLVDINLVIKKRQRNTKNSIIFYNFNFCCTVYNITNRKKMATYGFPNFLILQDLKRGKIKACFIFLYFQTILTVKNLSMKANIHIQLFDKML